MKAKKAREFWILESEYGYDIKRYFVSVCKSEAEAMAKKAWLDIKDPYDRHEVIHCIEKRRGKK